MPDKPGQGTQKDAWRELVQEALNPSGIELERVLPGKTDALIGKLANAYDGLEEAGIRLKAAYPADRRKGPEWKAVQYSWQLLWGAANALVGGFTLLQRGYPGETLAVGRVAMERFLAAVLLHDNPEIVARFEAGELERLYSPGVGPVSRVVKDFGAVWGKLSTLGTHVSRANVTTIIIEDDEDGPPQLRIGGHIGTGEVETQTWEKITNLYLWMAQIVATAPHQIFFSTERKRARLA